MTDAALVDRVRALPRADRLALYRALPPGALASQRYAPDLWARPEQRLPDLDALWTIEVCRGGRRSGKTQWATWLFNALVLSGRAPLPRIIAATDAAVKSTVIDGASGIMRWLPPHLRPQWTKSVGYAGKLLYPPHDGPRGRIPAVEVVCCSAGKPGQAIGMGRTHTFADDPAGWVESVGEITAAKTFREARVSNSEGPRPCIIVPTTKRGVSFLRALLTSGQMAGVRVRSIGDTRSNTSLAPSFLRDTIADLEQEGGDWAAEELADQDRDEAAGALWRRAWIDPYRVTAAPEMESVVVGVDPADAGHSRSDDTGIVVVGIAKGRLYVLADFSGQHDASVWPSIVAYAFSAYGCNAIVAETNRSASLVRRLLSIEAPNVPLQEVRGTQGKTTRAEPLSLLYRDGRVSHVISGPQLSQMGPVHIRCAVFDPIRNGRVELELEVARNRRRWRTLEDELCGWEPRNTSKSPGGLDALVWACWHLAPPDLAAATEWTPMARSPALAGRYDGADPRQGERYAPPQPRALTRFEQRRGGR